MILQQYIQEILFRQHTCCLPQLGVFKLTHTPARYDVTSKTISPPGEVITFEETLTNDGSLVKWISQKELLVPAIAQLKTEKYIDDFKQLLKKGEPVVIPGVGTLRANSVGRISFEQEPPVITRDVLHVSPVIRQDASHKVTIGTKEVVNNQVVDHLTAASSSAAASGVPAASTDQGTKPPVNKTTATGATENYEYEEFPQEIPSKLRWLWIAIPLACVATAAIVWWSVNKNRPAITRAESALTPPAVDRVPVEEPISSDSTALAPAAAQAQKPDTLEYYVFFQEYRTYKAADNMYRKRKGWGQSVELVPNKDSSLYRLGELFRTASSDTSMIKDSIDRKYKEKIKVYLELKSSK